MTKSQKFSAIFKAGKINVIKVVALGSYVHIDTYHAYEARIIDCMTMAGFRLLKASDCHHLDGFNGFRMVFVLA